MHKGEQLMAEPGEVARKRPSYTSSAYDSDSHGLTLFKSSVVPQSGPSPLIWVSFGLGVPFRVSTSDFKLIR